MIAGCLQEDTVPRMVEAQLLAAVDGSVAELVKASIGLGILELHMTARTGPTMPEEDNLRASSPGFPSHFCQALPINLQHERDSRARLTLTMHNIRAYCGITCRQR
jgi:hypothetical protein